jgi:hypothetical protein
VQRSHSGYFCFGKKKQNQQNNLTGGPHKKKRGLKAPSVLQAKEKTKSRVKNKKKNKNKPNASAAPQSH